MQSSHFHWFIALLILQWILPSHGSEVSFSPSADASPPTDTTSTIQDSSMSHTAAMKPTSSLSPLLMLPSAPPTSNEVSASHHPQSLPTSEAHRTDATSEAIGVAAILLLSALLLGAVVGLAKSARSYWCRSRDIVRLRGRPDAQGAGSVLVGEGSLRTPPPSYFPRPPSYADDVVACPVAQEI
ncbi:hypothetical protein B0H14DRAFT_2888110 [Mycena olivaceomarginata]|nr:hypothetical protein B0H14DRAFT_2888110 [Mycena olivaceomarginata]